MPLTRQMGDTALHLTLRNSHYALARVLVASGADVTIEDDEGQIPLDECKDEAVRRELKEAATEVRVSPRLALPSCRFRTACPPTMADRQRGRAVPLVYTPS